MKATTREARERGRTTHVEKVSPSHDWTSAKESNKSTREINRGANARGGAATARTLKPKPPTVADNGG